MRAVLGVAVWDGSYICSWRLPLLALRTYHRFLRTPLSGSSVRNQPHLCLSAPLEPYVGLILVALRLGLLFVLVLSCGQACLSAVL